MFHKSVLLAPSEIVNPSDLSYPLMTSRKYDGFRLFISRSMLYTRSMNLCPNKSLWTYLRDVTELASTCDVSLDGEIYSHERPFHSISSILRSHDKQIPSDFSFHIFDLLPHSNSQMLFISRYEALLSQRLDLLPNCKIVEQNVTYNAVEVREMTEQYISEGYEGSILRNPYGIYKHGRATVREHIIYKQKPFDNLDATVIGFEEQLSLNDSAPEALSPTGHTARTYKSSHFSPADTMGSLLVQDDSGRQFSLSWGRGWTHERRKSLWTQRRDLIGQRVTIRSLSIGEKDLPRHPQLIAFKDFDL